MAIRLDLDMNRLQQIGMNHAEMLVTRVTRGTLNRSAVLCPVDMGGLRNSGGMRVGRFGLMVRGQVEYDANYAEAVHNGTPAHIIRPKQARSKRNLNRRAMLRFEVDGRVVYAREVRHPGTKPRPFLTTALEQVAGPAGFRVSIG